MIGWARNAFTLMAMGDYPYPATFLAPLPAYPINVACQYTAEASSKLEGLARAVCKYYWVSSGQLFQHLHESITYSQNHLFLFPFMFPFSLNDCPEKCNTNALYKEFFNDLYFLL